MLTAVREGFDYVRQQGQQAYEERYPIIAVTGAPGCGKTVLVDHLIGVRGNYTPSVNRSHDEERRRRAFWRGKGPRYRVVPGHGQGGTHYKALERLLHSDDMVGLIHVMSNGYLTPRSDSLERETSAASLEDYLAENRAEELRELDEILTYLKMSVTARRRPKWLLLALSKSDLHQTDLTLQGGSPAAERVRALRDFVGPASLVCDALPVMTWLTDYTWRGHTVPSTATKVQRDQVITTFAERVTALIGHA